MGRLFLWNTLKRFRSFRAQIKVSTQTLKCRIELRWCLLKSASACNFLNQLFCRTPWTNWPHLSITSYSPEVLESHQDFSGHNGLWILVILKCFLFSNEINCFDLAHIFSTLTTQTNSSSSLGLRTEFTRMGLGCQRDVGQTTDQMKKWEDTSKAADTEGGTTVAYSSWLGNYHGDFIPYHWPGIINILLPPMLGVKIQDNTSISHLLLNER